VRFRSVILQATNFSLPFEDGNLLEDSSARRYLKAQLKQIKYRRYTLTVFVEGNGTYFAAASPDGPAPIIATDLTGSFLPMDMAGIPGNGR
jgi:hypothetical protein